jgi:hypothetical protein
MGCSMSCGSGSTPSSSGDPADLIYRDEELAQFELADTLALNSGIVILTYRLM